MTDTNQASEDDLRAEILTEFKQVHKLAPADYTENCTNVVMSIVQDHTNAEIAKVLDRLTAGISADIPNYYDQDGWEVAMKHIQSERALIEKRMM